MLQQIVSSSTSNRAKSSSFPSSYPVRLQSVEAASVLRRCKPSMAHSNKSNVFVNRCLFSSQAKMRSPLSSEHDKEFPPQRDTSRYSETSNMCSVCLNLKKNHVLVWATPRLFTFADVPRYLGSPSSSLNQTQLLCSLSSSSIHSLRVSHQSSTEKMNESIFESWATEQASASLTRLGESWL